MSSIETKTQTQTRITYPSMYSILAHNDDVTPMDFVVELLIEIFDKSLNEAIAVMKKIHDTDKQVVGTYSKEVAEQKLYEANQYCRMHGMQLKVSMEKIQ